MHRMVAQVLSPMPQKIRNSAGPGIVGEPFGFQVDPSWAGEKLYVEGKLYIPDADGRVSGLVIEKPALYPVTTSDGDVIRHVAANFPPEESRRDFLLPAILERQLLARCRAPGEDSDAARVNIPPDSGWWRWLLGALLVVWLAEPLLAAKTRDVHFQQKAAP